LSARLRSSAQEHADMAVRAPTQDVLANRRAEWYLRRFLRWLPRNLPADRVWVNVADERLVLYRDDRVVFSTRVIFGRDEKRNQSPELQGSIERILFNPPW